MRVACVTIAIKIGNEVDRTLNRRVASLMRKSMHRFVSFFLHCAMFSNVSAIRYLHQTTARQENRCSIIYLTLQSRCFPLEQICCLATIKKLQIQISEGTKKMLPSFSKKRKFHTTSLSLYTKSRWYGFKFIKIFGTRITCLNFMFTRISIPII